MVSISFFGICFLTSRLSDQAIQMEGISYYDDGPFFYNSCNIAESHISSIARTTSNSSSPFRISQVEVLSIFLVRTVLKQVSNVAPRPDGISLRSHFSREVTVCWRKIKSLLSCFFFLVFSFFQHFLSDQIYFFCLCLLPTTCEKKKNEKQGYSLQG